MDKILDYLKKYKRFKGIAQDIKTYHRQLTALGIDWDVIPESGLSGCSFKTKDGVIKLTTDSKEYLLFEKVKELGNLKGFTEVKYLEKLDNSYLIIKEIITPLHTLLKDPVYDLISELYIDFMQDYYQEIREYELGTKSLDRALSHVYRHLRRYGPKEAKHILDSLTVLAFRGFRLSDIDPNNIGLTKDHRLVIFDAQLRLIQLEPPSQRRNPHQITWETDHHRKVKYSKEIIKNKLHLTDEGGSSVLEMLMWGKSSPKTFVYLKDGRRIVGYAYVEHFPNRGEMGVYIHPEYRGQGYAVEALRQLKQTLDGLNMIPQRLYCSADKLPLFRQVFGLRLLTR